MEEEIHYKRTEISALNDRFVKRKAINNTLMQFLINLRNLRRKNTSFIFVIFMQTCESNFACFDENRQ